jgi:hypothetical protein
MTGEDIEAQASLAILKEQGADRFDPVCFRFIESMLSRSDTQRAAVSSILERKALKAIADFQIRFNCARNETKKTIEQASDLPAESLDRLQQLFDSCQFREAQRLAGRFSRHKKQSAQEKDSLAALGKHLLADKELAPGNTHTPAFEELLRQQENTLIRSLTDTTDSASQQGAQRSDELKAIRQLRKSRNKQRSEKRLNQAKARSPENPGPLNPQMLAIRSLSTMHELSPHYLNRFTSYIDTLLWLESAGEKAAKPEKTRAKKGKRGKDSVG